MSYSPRKTKQNVTFDFTPADNPGLELFRMRRPPSKTYSFPAEFDPNIHDLDSGIQRIAAESHSHIVLSRTAGRVRADIWAANQIESNQAAGLLADWVFKVVPKSKSRAWASGPSGYSYQGEVETSALGLMFSDAQAFTLKPSNATLRFLLYKKFVDWESAIIPTKCFGTNLEALDSIRTSCKVYILCRPKGEHFVFLIAGDDDQLVQKAEVRMKIGHRNVLAKQLIAEHQHPYYIVKPSRAEKLCSTVIFGEYVPPKLDHIYNRAPRRLPGAKPHDRFVTWGNGALSEDALNDIKEEFTIDDMMNHEDEEHERLPRSLTINRTNLRNGQDIEFWFNQIMYVLSAYVGTLQMQASIGICAFTSFPGPEVKLLRFETCAHDTNQDEVGFTSSFTQELGCLDTETELLDRFQACPNILVPEALGSSVATGPKQGVITFVLKHPSASKTYQLELFFADFFAGISIPTWSISDTNSTDEVLDMNLLDLQNPCLCYRLAITQKKQLDALGVCGLPQWFKDFPRKITLDPKAATEARGAHLFFDAEAEVLPYILSVEQRRSWRFFVADSDYVVDLDLLQAATMSNDSPLFNEDRWGVRLVHPVWREHLAQNASLKLGEMAKWAPEEYEFFPMSSESLPSSHGMLWKRGQGIEHLMNVMDSISRVISGEHVSDQRSTRTISKTASRPEASR